MGVYDPLTKHLKGLPCEIWDTNFAEIERIIARPLPKSAHEHRPWWANQRDSNHSQSKAWRDAGWEVRDINLARHTVRFERMHQRHANGPAMHKDEPLADMWRTAGELSGLSDRESLEREVLKAFIRRTAARRLAELGGSMPDFEAAPRERPFG